VSGEPPEPVCAARARIARRAPPAWDARRARSRGQGLGGACAARGGDRARLMRQSGRGRAGRNRRAWAAGIGRRGRGRGRAARPGAGVPGSSWMEAWEGGLNGEGAGSGGRRGRRGGACPRSVGVGRARGAALLCMRSPRLPGGSRCRKAGRCSGAQAFAGGRRAWAVELAQKIRSGRGRGLVMGRGCFRNAVEGMPRFWLS
jgi:hypothetical protein